MQELTKAEESVMLVLWELKKAFIKDVLEQMEEPKPAYTTVSTIVRILEQKGFVAHKAYGKTHEYYPIVSREAYAGFEAKHLLHSYFDGKLSDLISHFARKERIRPKEAKEIAEILKKLKKD